MSYYRTGQLTVVIQLPDDEDDCCELVSVTVDESRDRTDEDIHPVDAFREEWSAVGTDLLWDEIPEGPGKIELTGYLWFDGYRDYEGITECDVGFEVEKERRLNKMVGELQKLQTVLETRKHIGQVRRLLQRVVSMLLQRAEEHDASKLQSPEVEGFAEFTSKLATSTYGSDEYKQFLKDMQPFLLHHYQNNRHHPEHFEGSIWAMNLVDIIEMFCDWKAATLRHNDGDIHKSIEINTERFRIAPQLMQVFKNTVEILED